MKKLLVSLISILLTLGLVGCSNSAPIDKTALTKDILENISFEVELEQLGENAVGVMFTLENGVNAEVYKGSSVYPDQFGIFSAPSADLAKKTKAMLEEYRQSLLTDYSHYNADQLSKIEDAVIELRGQDVIFLISDQNDKARDIIKSH